MTKDEEKYQNDLRESGCIVCRLYVGTWTPADIHHILHAKKRIDEYHVLPLCFFHHRAGIDSARCVSRHPYKARFEQRYGTEAELLAKAREVIS